MLWQKESNGVLYIDLFENLIHPLHLKQLKRKKNNENALAARMAGNEKFKNSDFYGAMNDYNQSVCLAENGSQCLSLAYGNRSSCFEKLKMFSKCLIDIQLAKDSDYPQHLMKKLDDRKQRCISVQSGNLMAFELSLTYPGDENLPCMANILRIEVNDTYGRLITAAHDIKIGDIVLLEEDYVRFVVGHNVKCNNCGKQNANFIPCENCGGAMFCSKLCSENNFHRIECQMLFDVDICVSGNFFPLYVLRSIIIGLNAFSSTSELMVCIENSRATDPYEIPLSISSTESKYRAFLKLSSVVPDELSDHFLDYRKMAYIVYHSIKSSSLAKEFQTESQNRFLAHLIIHHICILQTNSFGSFNTRMKCGKPAKPTNTETDFEQSVLLVTSYINHSCCPNVAKLQRNNLSICRAVLPIRKGEQLFISYVDEDDDEYKTEMGRKIFLQSNFRFTCNCLICVNGIQRNTIFLQDDKAFVKVVEYLAKLDENFDLAIVRKIIENCEKILTKNPKMILSAESLYIKHNLIAMLQLDIDSQENE